MSSVWPVLHYHDTNAAVRYLVDVFGFTEVVAATDDVGDVVHAELSWPGGGTLVLGGTKHADSVHQDLPAGMAAIYVITADPGAVHERVLRARGDVVEAPQETRFGSGATSTVFTARDPEGTMWTFGTYAGAPADR